MLICASVGLGHASRDLAITKELYKIIPDVEISWLAAPPASFFQTLVKAKMTCGINKTLFGTDWPLFSPILSLERWVEGIKKMELPPPLKLMGLPEFNEEKKKKILGENAAKIFDL